MEDHCFQICWVISISGGSVVPMCLYPDWVILVNPKLSCLWMVQRQNGQCGVQLFERLKTRLLFRLVDVKWYLKNPGAGSNAASCTLGNGKESSSIQAWLARDTWRLVWLRKSVELWPWLRGYLAQYWHLQLPPPAIWVCEAARHSWALIGPQWQEAPPTVW